MVTPKTGPLCALCGKPTPDNAYVCTRRQCAGGLEQVLAEIPALATELGTTLARQDQISRNGKPDAADLLTAADRERISQADAEASVHIQGMPYALAASMAGATLRAVLVGWVRVVIDERGGAWPADTIAVMGTYLHAQVEWLRHQPFAADAVPEIKRACWDAWNACDRPADRVYAGPCDAKGEFGEPCPESLYAVLGAETIECGCGLTWDVAARREWLLEAADQHLVTAAELSRFLTVYGEPVSGERIRKWVERGQLLRHGADERGHPLYRVGDATILLERLGRKTA